MNCIHPTPDEPDFLTSEMLYIDPTSCVDCGACVTACPVEAIVPHSKLTDASLPFLRINAEYFGEPKPRPILAPILSAYPAPAEPLRVAIVGSGPAAMYAADELLSVPGTEVDMYERLPFPYGLARLGVAPDHERTRRVSELFDKISVQEGFRLHTGVEIGRDLTHDQLKARFDAVVYAVGAASDRRLDVPGAALSSTATEFVAWYNGHPDFADRTFDLSGRRAVVIGNGNVALDVARILTTDPDRLATTDIAPHALEALRASKIEEVVVVARRGPEHSAFTLPELVGLLGHDLSVDPDGITWPELTTEKLTLLRKLADRPRGRMVLRYNQTPSAFLGDETLTAVEFTSGARLDAGLALTSIGYRAVPIPDLPFDDATGTVPHTAGKVSDGVYVTGWIKRGPTGFLGTNKTCAQETIRTLFTTATTP
ncbi:FAD-dependent oxidoreductase [Actinocorallia lasiicapitis]